MSKKLELFFGSPGSGKTTQLLSRVAELVAEGAKPGSILVVVPNRQSAALLRDRVLRVTGWAVQSDLVRTPQALAFELVRVVSAADTGQEPPTLITGAGQAMLLRQILEGEFGKAIRAEWALPAMTLELPSFIAELRDLIAICQSHGVDPSSIIQIGRSANRSLLVAAGRLLGEYRTSLTALNQIDPQQLIGEAVSILRGRPECRLAAEFVLVDDAQEFSATELQMIAMLNPSANLYAFSDPDATVLGFRAAAPTDLARILGEGRQLYRHDLAAAARPAAIAQLMEKLVSRIPTALGGTHRATLSASAVPDEAVPDEAVPDEAVPDEAVSTDSIPVLSRPLVARVFDSVAAENDFVADVVRRLQVAEGRDWSEIAIVLRTRSQIDQLSTALSQHGIPVRVPGAQANLAGFGVAGDVLRLIAAASTLGISQRGSDGYTLRDHSALDRSALEALLGSRLSQLDALDIRSLKRRLNLEPEGMVAAFASLLIEGGFPELKGAAANKARRFGKLLTLAATANQLPPHQFISAIWKELDLERRLIQDSWALSEVGFAAQRDLDSMVELVSAASRFTEQNPDSTALDFALRQLQLEVAEDSLAPASKLSAVQLLTPAGLIGRRFPVVIAPRLQEGIWPNLRPRNSLMSAASIDAYLRGASEEPLAPVRTELDQELRSFYKTLGAAKESLFLTAVQLEDESPSQFFAMMGVRLGDPVSYRREHDLRARVARLRQQLRREPSARNAALLAVYARSGAPGAHPDTWYGRLNYSTNQPISIGDTGPTVSPSQLEKFAKCPLHWFISTYGGEGKGFEASVGTLLHEALELGGSSFESLWQVVESKWGQLNIESEWQMQAERRRAVAMVQAMSGYLAEVEEHSVESVAREKFVSHQIHGLEVRGTIDRLERLADQSLRVVDLKTGQVGTKLEVANNLQLALYQLLVEAAYPAERLSGAMILGVKGGKLSKLEQPPLTPEFRKVIQKLFERAKSEFPGPLFKASITEHCSAPGSICSILNAPEVTN